MHSRKEQYIVRLPDGMRDRIKEEAERNQRSMNAEIVFHLRNALSDTPETKKLAAEA